MSVVSKNPFDLLGGALSPRVFDFRDWFGKRMDVGGGIWPELEILARGEIIAKGRVEWTGRVDGEGWER